MADAEIGVAYFTLLPSARGLAASMEAELVGPAGAAGAKAGASAGSSLASNLKTVLIGAGIATFLKGAFDQVQAFQKVTGQTGATIASTSDASGQSAKGVAQLSDQLSKLDGINRNVVQSGANVALQFTNIKGDNFKRATADALDFSAATGRAIPAAAQLLDRALQDPVAGMARLRLAGVVLTTQQKEAIKTFQDEGNTAAAQGVLFDAFEQKFAGSAQAQATAADHAKVAVQGLEQSVGKDLLPALSAGANLVTFLATSFSKLPTVVQQVSGAAVVGAVVWTKYGSSIEGAGSSLLKSLQAHGAAAAATKGAAVAAAEAAAGDEAYEGSLTALATAQAQAVVAEKALAKAMAEDAATFGPAGADTVALAAARQDLAAATLEVDIAQKRANLSAAGVGTSTSEAIPATVGLSAAMGPLAVILGGVAAGAAVDSFAVNTLASRMKSFKGSPTELANELALFGQTGHATGQLLAAFGGNLQTLGADVKTSHSGWVGFASDLGSVGRGIAGIATFGAAKLPLDRLAADGKNAKGNIKEVDQALVQIQATMGDSAAAAAFNRILQANNLTAAQGYRDFTSYASGVRAAAAEEAREAATTAGQEQAHRDLLRTLAAGAQTTAAFGQSVETVSSALKTLQADTQAANGQGFDIAVLKAQAMETAKTDATALAQADQQLAQAEDGLTTAEQGVGDALHARDEAVYAVGAAERGLTDALHSEADAVYSLKQAQAQLAADEANQLVLVKNLAAARQQAADALKDQQLAAEGDQLSVKDAKLNVQAALDALRLGPAAGSQDYGLDLQRLRQQYAEAQLALAQASQHASESSAANDAAQAAGVNGSPQVTAAQAAINAGNQQVAGDQHSVSEAQTALASSQQGVEDAAHNIGNALHDLSTANRGVVTAEGQVVTAHQQVGTAAANVALAEQKSASDRIDSARTIIAAEDTAKDKLHDDRLAVTADWGLMQTAALNYAQIGIGGVLAYLKLFETEFPGAAALLGGQNLPLAYAAPTSDPASIIPLGPTGGVAHPTQSPTGGRIPGAPAPAPIFAPVPTPAPAPAPSPAGGRTPRGRSAPKDRTIQIITTTPDPAEAARRTQRMWYQELATRG